MSKYVVFRLAEEQYGIPIDQVRSIETMLPITRIPGTERYVLGVMNLRGVIIPVIDLRLRLGLPANLLTGESRIIVIVPENGSEVGVVVDAAENVIDVSEEQIQPAGDAVNTIACIDGIATVDERIFALLDVESTFGVA